jgi:peptidoglycan/LPS O-acetylase OafA/YrhL
MEIGQNKEIPLQTSLRGRIASLDGLRAVAILLVIKSHLSGSFYIVPFLGAGRFPVRFTLGSLGVRIFFVISGLLITTLLLREIEETGRISLKQFYVRRALRILPASYAYLLCLAIAVAIGIVMIPRVSFLASLFYVRNYLGNDWYTGHLWSLSVEEQFYLIWPAIMVFLGSRRALIAAFCTLPLADFMRTFRPETGFETNMDALACGCILACLWETLGRNERWQSFLRSGFFWLTPIAVLASNKLDLMGGTWLAIGTGIVNVLIAISIERFVRYPHSVAGRLLNLRTVAFVGTLSYSLYLWQQPWIVFMGGQQPWLAFKGGHGIWQTAPLNLAVTFCCAALSYKFIERPFLQLRNRFRIARGAALVNCTETVV